MDRLQHKDNERLTRKQKKANDYQWYKDKADIYETEHLQLKSGVNQTVDDYRRMKVNYDLFNNILNLSDFEYVCQPFGAEQGELPAQMVNRDISSYRIKALIGMEMKRPFGYKLLAVNPEATTRKEEEHFRKVKEFVVESTLAPIRAEIEAKHLAELEGQEEPNPQKIQEIRQQIEKELQSNTPDHIRKYMKRKHQDPAEVQGHQLLEYLKKQQKLNKKFNDGWKHALLSAYEIYYVGEINGRPVVKSINPIRFSCDMSPDIDFIEEGEWAVAEYRMTPSQIIQSFKLINKEIDEIYENYNHRVQEVNEGDWFGSDVNNSYYEDQSTLPVKHIQFKGLRKVGWLDYIDQETGEVFTKFLVDEEYTLNKEEGDIFIQWEWIPETYEIWKIGKNIYKNPGPVKGQTKDENNLYVSNLSYYGAIYDNTNSVPTSVMDRMKVYQYYYNIVMYRLELLLASDDGKKVLMNINAIPSESGIDIEKWQYFFKSTPFMWYNPDEEGMTGQDVNTIAKTLDMSVASDIGKYIELAEFLEQKCGKSVGVTDPVLGQTSVSEKVANNQQNLVQTGHMLEPYFDLHAQVKVNVMQALVDVARIVYSREDAPDTLNFFLDDMSLSMLKLDKDMLDNETLGLFVEDSSVAEEAKQNIRQLAHAAMQNQKVELSDVLKVLNHESITEAQEELELAEEKRIEREEAQKEADRQNNIEVQDRQDQRSEREHEQDLEAIITKEEERRKTVIQQQVILSMGFNEDKDVDGDGIPDVLEVARQGIDADIKMREQNRKDLELAHKVEKEKEDLSIKRQAMKNKVNSPKV